MAAPSSYLALADQLLDQAQLRPDEAARLTRAADVAARLADLAADEEANSSGYLDKARALIELALTAPLTFSAVNGAGVYADMARTYAAQQRRQQEVTV